MAGFAISPYALRLRFATLNANLLVRACRRSLIMAVVLLVMEARLAGSRRRARRTEDQALRLGLQFTDQLFEQARGPGETGAECFDVGRGLPVELAAQVLDGVFDLRRLAHRFARFLRNAIGVGEQRVALVKT